jgi:hypothetical protein
VPARSRHLEHTPCSLLTPDIAEIGSDLDARRSRLLRSRRITLPPEVLHRFDEVPHRDGLDAGESDLGSRFGRAHESPRAVTPRALGRCEGAGHGPEPAVERELADRGVAGQGAGRKLPRRREHRQGNREVESRPFLAKIGRGEVDRDAA